MLPLVARIDAAEECLRGMSTEESAPPTRLARAPALRVLSNRSWLSDHLIAGRPVIAESFHRRPEGLRGWLRFLALWRYDLAFFDCTGEWLFAACAIKKVLPFARCKIASVDLILTRPSGLLDGMKFLVRRWLLREVDRFLLYYRDTSELETVYGIPSGKVRYVPFKPNTLELLVGMETTDEGYLLACGRSNRDYQTLFEALRPLPYHCCILAPWGTQEHDGSRGTGMEEFECPPNVSLLSDDGSVHSWNRWIAGATAVVLPIEPGMLSPSGIGTYLVAMTLGKCVIITEGPATRQILDDRLAVLVPPADVDALRDAIVRTVEDPDYRNGVAAGGRRYALSLGGDERLRRDVIRELSAMLE
jgi:glycosyltransferase involved in cell wall biosynthesis